MTKAELLQWLNDQGWCNEVGTPEVVDAASGWQKVIVREVYENTAITRAIHFYETPDGCYWKDSAPVATLEPPSPVPTYKMITFRTLINELDGTLIASIMAKLKAAVSQNVIIEQAYKMLETYGPDGGIDINSRNTQLTIQSLVTTGVLIQAEADAVIALAD